MPGGLLETDPLLLRQDASGARPPAPALARRVQTGCLDRGLIVEPGGRDGAVVRFLPPLVIPA